MMEQRSDFVKSHEENRHGKSRITAKRDWVIADQSCGADESIYGAAKILHRSARFTDHQRIRRNGDPEKRLSLPQNEHRAKRAA
jgi:hypothetical protein